MIICVVSQLGTKIASNLHSLSSIDYSPRLTHILFQRCRLRPATPSRYPVVFKPFVLFPSRRILIKKWFNLELIKYRLRRFRYELIKTSCSHFLRIRTMLREDFRFYGNRVVEESESYLASLLYCDSISRP